MLSFSYIWPIALVVCCNVLYQVCTKGLAPDMNPLASLTVTYAVGTLSAAGLYYLTTKDASLLREYSKLNWAPFALGVVCAGLETGFLYAYRNGWPVSTAEAVQGAYLAVALLVVGAVFYHESLSWTKVLGVGALALGIFLLNK